jgi:hypothetical protein
MSERARALLPGAYGAWQRLPPVIAVIISVSASSLLVFVLADSQPSMPVPAVPSPATWGSQEDHKNRRQLCSQIVANGRGHEHHLLSDGICLCCCCASSVAVSRCLSEEGCAVCCVLIACCCCDARATVHLWGARQCDAL